MNERKAAQAAARFLSASGGSMDRLKFVKLMYLMDRTALLWRGAPVTNDVYFSLPMGPVPSGVYDLIRHSNENSFWARHIARPNNRTVKLISDPGNDQLSEAEEDLIDWLADKYKDWHPTKLKDFTHQLQEWKDPGRGSIRIDIAEILEAANRSPQDANTIKCDLEGTRHVEALFSPFT